MSLWILVFSFSTKTLFCLLIIYKRLDIINNKIKDDDFIVLYDDVILTKLLIQRDEGGLYQTLDDNTYQEIITGDPDSFDFPTITEIKNYFKRYKFINKTNLHNFKISKGE